MITLILLHPIKSIPIQQWTFQKDSIIKIGRATDNNVVIYSAVVSRHHIEIRSKGKDWVLINKGSNGTFVNKHKVKQALVYDGMIFRLASSGPKIEVRLNQKPKEEDLVIKKDLSKVELQKRRRQDISKETVIHEE